jgi:hypothetical protein
MGRRDPQKGLSPKEGQSLLIQISLKSDAPSRSASLFMVASKTPLPAGGKVPVPSHPQRELKRSGANKGNDATPCYGEAKR